MSSAEYEAVSAFQEGLCYVSRKPPKTSLHIDHDHKTGQIRGLLSPWINKGLSYFQDNPVWLRRAAEYLENPPVSHVLGEDVYGVIGRMTKKAKNRKYGPLGTKTPQPRTFQFQTKTKTEQGTETL
jgi:hypothetical protein